MSSQQVVIDILLRDQTDNAVGVKKASVVEDYFKVMLARCKA
jgi:hypothetical protein